MTTFTKNTLAALLRIADYVMAFDPPPETDATLVALKDQLNSAGNTLKASMEADSTSKGT